MKIVTKLYGTLQNIAKYSGLYILKTGLNPYYFISIYKMIFDDYLWVYIKTFLFNPDDIQRRISHNKQKIQTQIIFKNWYLPTREDLYYKFVESDSDSDLDL